MNINKLIASCLFGLFAFSYSSIAESITGFQELQLCQKETQIEHNIEQAEKGTKKAKYSVGWRKHNFPFDGEYIEYYCSDKEKDKLLVKYYYFGNPNVRTLYMIDMLWECIDETKAKTIYFEKSALICAENQARQLAIGLGKKYKQTPRKVGKEYQIRDPKTNNVLAIFITPVSKDLADTFGNECYLDKSGYYIRVMYVNLPLAYAAKIQDEKEEEDWAEKQGKDSGL